MKKFLIVDGNSILNRAYYGVRILTNKDGLPTNAIFGMVNILSKQIEAVKPDYMAVAFDLKAPTFRHKMYADYKAGRKPMPDELRVQFPYAKDVCRALGFTVVEKEGYEADDILGTLAQAAADRGDTAYVLTGDKDSLQLISEDGKISVLLAGNVETTHYDSAKFREKYGIPPALFVDVKALMGDSSDNIPGVPGIGEKTALKLIAEHSTIEALYENLSQAQLTPSVRAKLESGHQSALMSKELATICRTAPVEKSAEAYESVKADKKALLEMFKLFEFSSLIKKMGLDTPENEDSETEVSFPNVKAVDANDVSALLSDSAEAAVCVSDDTAYIYTNGELLSCSETKKIFEAFIGKKTKVICYDCKELYKKLSVPGIDFRDCYFDIMLGEYVLNAASSFTLDKLALEYENISREIPEEYRAFVIYNIYKQQKQKIDELGFEKLLFDIEMPLAAVLADMEMAGFKVDVDGLIKFGENLDNVANQLKERIFFSAGCEFNLNSPKQLGEVLFEKLGLPAEKKTQKGYSTSAEILEKLRPFHPIIDDILEYRKVTKLKSTYVEGLTKVADENGRVHSSFNQTGTATGRLSSSEPNLQNIPIRTELGREMRRFFVPRAKDYVLIDADYSQIELRLLAAISGDRAMISAFKSGYDIHTATAATVFGVAEKDVDLELRKRAKAVNFGIVYGIGDFSLSQDLGISRAAAKKYIESYLAAYPMVDAYLKGIIESAYENGFVTTLFGRRRYIPELAGQNKVLKKFGERVAMNSPIQGSAADIIKIAMIKVSEKLKESGIDARLILQVHDELILEAHVDCADRAAEILSECMENALSLDVPLSADSCIGKNWYECK
ncbi:MAG: DNA polymerase I [Clostridia bacterium]|nr:DNA polymerase I [Clostridia bacterium]